MKVITKCVIDIGSGQVLEEESYDYQGPVAKCDFGGAKYSADNSAAAAAQVAAMQKQMYEQTRADLGPYRQLGEKAFEVWYNAGGDNSSVDNPTFALYKDGVYDVGIIAPASITDLQGAAVSWLSNRRDLILAQGINPVAISNQMFSREIETYSTIEDANAFSYVDGGHTFLQINFPTANKTWCFDATTKSFFKKQSIVTGTTYGRHRANCYALFNNKHYVGDYINGKIYEMNQSFYDDDGLTIRREVYTKEIDNGITSVRHGPVQLMTETGLGTADSAQVMLKYSNNSGHTWSSELLRNIGDTGEYNTRSIWYRLGSSAKRMYHLAMTAPVLWRILGVDTGSKGGIS